MTGAYNGVDAYPAETLAAVVAAVQAYLDEEAQVSVHRVPKRLSAWKTASWGMIRTSGAQWRRGSEVR